MLLMFFSQYEFLNSKTGSIYNRKGGIGKVSRRYEYNDA